MFDRTVRMASEKAGDDNLFSCLDEIFEKADAVIANLEGPITENVSKSVGSAVGTPNNYVFTFPTTTATLLYRHHIRAVTLGNNHILNFGRAGLDSTRTFLNAAGVAHFGDPYTWDVAQMDAGSLSLVLIGYNEFDPAGWRAAASTTRDEIAVARRAGGQPIVFGHWGEEYRPATERQKELAHSFVDAGAAFVVGAHPHVVQEHETYHGVKIYYSLGNLIFDQYWNDDVRRGLMVEAVFGPAGVESLKEIPVELQRDRRTCPVDALH